MKMKLATGRLAILHVHTYVNIFLKAQCHGFTSCGTGIPTKRIQGKSQMVPRYMACLKSAVRSTYVKKEEKDFHLEKANECMKDVAEGTPTKKKDQ